MVTAIWTQPTYGVQWITENWFSEWVWSLATGSDSGEIMTFKLDYEVHLIRCLDDAIHSNRPHQNKMRRSAIANRSDTMAQMLSNIISNDLTHVSVPAEDIKHALKGSSTCVPTHARSRSAFACPIMPIMDQYFHTYFKSYKLSTNNQTS
jgi:hypothetical protein